MINIFFQPPLTKDVTKRQEDNHSETSGETNTSDSGRGGSEDEANTSRASASAYSRTGERGEVLSSTALKLMDRRQEIQYHQHISNIIIFMKNDVDDPWFLIWSRIFQKLKNQITYALIDS